MNVMGDEEAKGAQVKPKDRTLYFRVDDDAKANMQTPAESATWYKIFSVPLYNDPIDQNAPGDSVGVVVKWELPGVFAGIAIGDLPRVQAKIDGAQSVQANDWEASRSRKFSISTCRRRWPKSASKSFSPLGSSQKR